MKKCGSCSKDLPDAALHCVFCGAKQAPAAAVQSSVAKTAFGYSAADLPEIAKRGVQPAAPQPTRDAPSQPNFAQPQGAPRPHSPSQAPNPQPPDAGYAATQLQPRSHSPSQAPQPQGAGYAATQMQPRPHSPSQPNYPAGPAAAQAKTMFAPAGGPPQQQGMGGPQQGFGGPQQPHGMGPGFGGPQQGFGGPQQGFGGPPPGMGGPQQGGFGGPQQGFGGPPPGMGGPQQGFGGPQQQGGPGYGAPPPGMVGNQPGYGQPPQQQYQQPPPYLASQTAAHAGRPIEPWRDSLRLMMFVWGAVLIAAFVTPVATEPKLAFHWNTILDAAGKAKVPPLVLASIGLLSVILGAMPLAALPRGILAAVLGLAGIFVPLLLATFPPWRALLPLVAILTLVPGLLVRNEYRESIVPRVLVTIGVVCFLLPELVPTGGQIPLVNDFKQLIDAPGKAKVGAALDLAIIVVVVLSLLAWMPAPATGGAKVFAWILILAGVAHHLVHLLTSEHLGAHIKGAPYETLMAWAPMTTYAVLVGYGLATVFGKQLE